ncbi:hypothetical protein FB45DRAFT_88070 [Roridomyces roridus]|uniref:DUF6533 domain-containing protein n=1 Tax=Roridomyces roridus TaxID=1738132 RepID=A0AAD7BM84_9AGAR|nr:hypothetical protein FB45DRAFT_88070 [Roridomyces roridus]
MAIFQVYEFAFVCCSIASVALLVWDHVITFGAEVQNVWPSRPSTGGTANSKPGRKLSGATVLYALLRYGTLFEKITVLLLASSYFTPRGCNIAVRVQIFPMLLRTVGFGLFSSLRVLALSQMNYPLAGLVFLLCIPSAIVPSYVYSHQTATAVNIYGCQLAYTASPVVHDRLRIAGIIADLLSETLVILVTLNRTLGILHTGLSEKGKKQKPTLSWLLLRDGTIYFIALLTLSLADMLVLIFDHVPEFATRYDYWVVPYYTPVFRTIIICRFMLMLREVYFADLRIGSSANANEGSGVGTSDDGQSMHFRVSGTGTFASRVIGSMGGAVDASQFDGDEYDFEDEDFEEGEGLGGHGGAGAGGEQEQSGVMYAADPLAAGLRSILRSEQATAVENGEVVQELELAMSDLSSSPPTTPSAVDTVV